MRIYLIGYMGSGKSTLGKKLAKHARLQFIDMDHYIEKRNCKTVPQIFAEEGEAEFRKKERNALEELSAFSDVVIATGGGAPCFFDNVDLMNRTGKTIYLNIDPKIRNKAVVLQITNQALTHVKDALENKRGSHSDTTFETVLQFLRNDCNIPKLMISSHYCLGTGSRLTLTTPGNFDIGFNTLSDIEFMQIRNPWEDPNLVQFWIQWEMGMRIQNFHKRGFMISDGDTVGNELSGDYDAGSGSGSAAIGV